MANVVCTVDQLQVGDRFMHWARPLLVKALAVKDKKITVSAYDNISDFTWSLRFEGAWKVMKVLA